MFPVSQRLYLNGYNIAYYETTPGSLDLINGRPAFPEMEMQIKNGAIRQVAIFGHSHGGGAVYNLSKLLNDRRASLGPFTLVVTGYVDAIEYDGIFTSNSELRIPLGTTYHWNYYQPKNRVDEILYGGPVTGALVNLDVTTTSWGAELTHTSIDGSSVVQSDLENLIRGRVISK
jgi:hypothetical protein